MKKFNYSKCLLWLFVVGSILSCTEDAVTPKLEVSFNYNYTGAPKATTQPANSGSKINTPTTPTRLGYTFKAWNTNATGTGTDFNFETTPITKNITLYAKWIQTFAVSFNYNYTDASAPTKELIEINKKVNKPTADPTRLGYTFKAWNTNATGTGTDFNFETTPITKNITLYAKWIQTFAVSFNYNYTEASAPTKELIEINKKVNKPTADPTRSGYTFKGWNTNATGTGTDFDFQTTPITGDLTLYAKWEIITYTVTFNYNYTGATPAVATQTANSGSKINTPTNPTRSDYIFKAWNTNATGTGTPFDFKTTPITENITLYAKWVLAINVTFNYNYTDAPKAFVQKVAPGQTTKAPTTLPDRANFTIGSWNLNSDGTGTDFNFETTTITEDITLYAQWLYYPLNKSALQALLFTQNVDPTKIDTGRITDMSELFKGKTSFNGDISSWDTSKVTNMSSMFYSATAFNQNISGWDTSMVTYMGGMFLSAPAFNQDISGWNTSNAIYMSSMFYNASKFNGNISTWNTSKVTTMRSMFYNASVFNQDLSKWNTSKVDDMQSMFANATIFNSDISGWNTSNVSNMFYMFQGASTFNRNLSTWNTSKVTNMYGMFRNAKAFNQDLSTWNTSMVTNMQSMFDSASAFNQDLSKWNTSMVTNMQSMFYKASAFSQDLSTWEVSKVTTMRFMFNSSLMANTPCQWPVAFRPTGTVCLIKYPVTFNYNYTDAPKAFIQKVTTGQTTTAPTALPDRANFTIGSWNLNPDGTGSTFNFETTTITKNITLYAQWVPAVTLTFNYNYTDAPKAFVQKIATGQTTKTPTTLTDRANFTIGSWTLNSDGTGPTFDFETTTITENITLYAQWLYYPLNKSALQTLLFTQNVDPTKIDTGRITDMSYLFKDKTTFNGDISSWDTSKVDGMQVMFSNASAFNGNISKWNTSKVTTMQSMFSGASAFNGDISKWNTSKVTAMDFMFKKASAFNGNISKWNTSEVTDMSAMFSGASAFNGDISKWNTSKVDDMSAMFQGPSIFNGDISKWNTSEVTAMSAMFADASAFNGDLSTWDVSKVTSRSYMFDSSPMANKPCQWPVAFRPTSTSCP